MDDKRIRDTVVDRHAYSLFMRHLSERTLRRSANRRNSTNHSNQVGGVSPLRCLGGSLVDASLGLFWRLSYSQ